MSEQDKSFVVMKIKGIMSKDHSARLKEVGEMVSGKIGMPALVVDESVDVEMHQDLAPKLDALIEEQQKTNQLLMQLVQTLAEEADYTERD